MFVRNEKYDRLSSRNIELARQVRDLNKENKAVYEENKDLRFENEEQQDILNEIRKIVTEKGQGTIVDRFDKIKELVTDSQSEN